LKQKEEKFEKEKAKERKEKEITKFSYKSNDNMLFIVDIVRPQVCFSTLVVAQFNQIRRNNAVILNYIHITGFILFLSQ